MKLENNDTKRKKFNKVIVVVRLQFCHATQRCNGAMVPPATVYCVLHLLCHGSGTGYSVRNSPANRSPTPREKSLSNEKIRAVRFF